MNAGANETQITARVGGRGAEADTAARNVWLKPARIPRDEPTLNRARIVEEALALLDGEGIERLTMRRLAERLGHGSTTLYWHVDTKDDVLDLCLDAIYGEVPRPEHSGDWRGEITTMLTGWRTVLLRHRWSTALVGRPMIGPNILAHMEFLQSSLLRAGLTDTHLSAATWGLYNLVMGAAVSRTGWLMPADEQTQAQQHLSTQHDHYPTLAAHGYMLDNDWDGTFARSLDYLLDGIQAQIERGGTSGS
ncbi:TetR/AcrR family transcriptional regulator [Nocardia sp. XZ_19_385]|uniref:TetR/AcrR family transcriptional regulator n=1 Tax=Nocardia sp. XZ_19_385 TaxID=2769488 RepID=UPI00188F07FA|nr:TetR/AcrR family transcriptional regulator C-terminal domain-containing protein [Nocardia sp. XZ_19_385]